MMQHCIACNISLCETLHCVQHCIACYIAFRATLHSVQNCIPCNIALHTTLHCMELGIALHLKIQVLYVWGPPQILLRKMYHLKSKLPISFVNVTPLQISFLPVCCTHTQSSHSWCGQNTI